MQEILKMKLPQFTLYLEQEIDHENKEQALRIIAVNLGANGKKKTVQDELDRLIEGKVIHKVGDAGPINDKAAIKEALKQSKLRRQQQKPNAS